MKKAEPIDSAFHCRTEKLSYLHLQIDTFLMKFLSFSSSSNPSHLNSTPLLLKGPEVG
jgi:hypothetical protein